MADLKRTIEILFQGTNRVSGVVTSVGRDLDKLNYSISAVASPFASVTSGVLKLDAALLALATGTVVYATKTFQNYQDVMLKVKGIMGASEEEYKQLMALTKELGATTRFTATESAQGLEFLALAGFKFEEAMAGLPVVLNLAQAAAMDLGTTADIVTNIMTGYGIAVEDLGKTADVLTATFTNSNTNLEELGVAFAYVGPVAKALGLDLEETASILGQLANSGYKAEKGGTALRNILLALVAPAGNAGKLMKELGVDTSELGVDLASSSAALKSLGVNVKDAEGNLQPFSKIMGDLKTGLEKIHDPADRAAILVEIFGKRGGPQMAALLEKGSEAVSGLEETIRGLGGVTNKIAAEMESGIGGALRSLRSAFESVAIESGEKFASGLTGPIYGVRDVLQSLRLSINEGMFDPIFEALNRFEQGLAEDLKAIATNLPEALEDIDYTGLIDSLGGLGDQIGGLFEGIDFDDPESLAQAIQKIIDTLESLVDFSDGIAGIFISVAKEIGSLIEKFNNLDEGTKRSFGSISGLGSVISNLTGPIGSVTGAVKGMGTALNVIAGGQVVNLVRSLVGSGGLTAALGAVQAHPLIAAGAAGLAMGTAWRKLVPEVDQAAQSVLGFIDKHTGLLGVANQQAENERQWIEIQQRWKQIMADRAAAAEDAEKDFKETSTQIEDTAVSVEWLSSEMRKLGILVEEPKKVNVDTKEAKQKFQELEYYREGKDGKGYWTTLYVEANTDEVETAKKKIEEIPAAKRLEFETDLKIAEVKAKAETIQNALKYKAQVDIAEIEAAAKVTTTLSTNITEMFANTGKQITDLYSQWDKGTSLAEKWSIQESLRAETETRERTLKMQEKLNDAHIKFLKARTKRMESGEALITVDGASLQPHLEMIMWELFGAIQIRAKEEGLDQLLLGGL